MPSSRMSSGSKKKDDLHLVPRQEFVEVYTRYTDRSGRAFCGV